MRLVPFFLLLLLLINCKRQERLDPIPPVAAEPALPRGILDFKVVGVPKENIRFSTFGSVNGELTNRHVIISLPADYPYGDTIKIVAKIPKGYRIVDPFKNELNPDGFSFAYHGAEVGFFAVDSLGGHNQIELYVNPVKPIGVASAGKVRTYTIGGNDESPDIEVRNWGTYRMMIKKADGLDSLVDGYAEFRNVKTGAMMIGLVGSAIPHLGYDRMYVGVPTTITDGEYEITLVRHDRRAVVPYRMILKYGLPKVTGSNYFKGVFNHEDNAISYTGFNLLDHIYEIELSSFFFPKKRFPLIPINHLLIATKLPMELAPGTYKAILYLNGKALSDKNPLTGQSLVFIRKSTRLL